MDDFDRQKYSKLAQSGVSPLEFYELLQNDAVSKFDSFILLRDEFSLGLVECAKIAGEYEQKSAERRGE